MYYSITALNSGQAEVVYGKLQNTEREKTVLLKVPPGVPEERILFYHHSQIAIRAERLFQTFFRRKRLFTSS